MLRNILSLMALSLFALNAQAASITQVLPASSVWDISSVTLTEVDEKVAPAILVENDCTTLGVEKPAGILDGIDWSSVVAMGEKVWQVIEANKPVVNVKTPVVHALPRGLSCWADLEHWHAPQVKSYDVVYKNGFGMEAVKFRFRLQYTYGGGKGEMGRYIANATVMPAELNVLWGFNFDAGVEVEQAVNLGTLDNPMAGLEMNLKWTLKNVFSESQNSFHFFVQGDGISQAVN
jgi:hypothetical protein